MDEEYMLSRYLSAVELLPRHLKEKLYRLEKNEMIYAEEIRLRVSSGLSVISEGHEIFIETESLNTSELYDIVCAASNSSLHTAIGSIREGFITADNGHRIGICGTAAVRDGKITGINNFSSLAIRISKEIPGVADGLPEKIQHNGLPDSTLIISPPGGGKTTLLRDLIRIISNSGVRTAVADERGEIAAVKNGVPQLDVGRSTDVMDMCPRSEAAMYLIRSMNPEMIAMDEISSERESAAVNEVAGFGVTILATAHSGGIDELHRKKHYRELMESGIFRYVVTISAQRGRRTYKVEGWDKDD